MSDVEKALKLACQIEHLVDRTIEPLLITMSGSAWAPDFRRIVLEGLSQKAAKLARDQK